MIIHIKKLAHNLLTVYQMKKILGFFTIISLFVNCANEVRFSEPGLQANKNNVVWRAFEIKGSRNADGSVTIVANADDGSITLKIASSAKGKYVLGTTNSNNKASHTIVLSSGMPYIFDTTPIAGPAAAISSLFSGGTAYTASTNAATTTSGVGSGLTVSTTVSAGTVTKATILSPGNNYFTGDVITIVGGNNFANFAVLNVEESNGEINITDNSDGTLTGTFQFNAKSPTANLNGSQNVGFQNGNFFRIPLKQL